MRFNTLLLAAAGLAASVSATVCNDYWYKDITHQGNAPYAESGYSVYRNVMDYGATGDGSTDDTAAINAALTDGSRCGEGCASSTKTPAVVFFPAGTYIISSPLYPPYFTQMLSNPNCSATIKASSGFSGSWMIDADPYYTSDLNWGSTNVFYRQIRNFIIDTTSVAASTTIYGIHWPTSQATSLQNIVFNMPTTSGVQHIGLFIESGSAGYLGDLTFNGGNIGADLGNQQFTTRNLVFNNCITAIYMFWDWGWTFMGLSINNATTGIDMSAGGSSAEEVGSVIVIDSSFTNVKTGISTAWSSSSSPAAAGSLILENIAINDVPIMVTASGSTVLSGTTGTETISAWKQGHQYTGTTGPSVSQGSFTANSRPSALLSGSSYYVRSKPQYETYTSSQFVSVRSSGAKGDGSTDDTAAFQSAITTATAAGKIVYIDYGLYKLTDTITIPAGTKMVGETYPVLMASGSKFTDMSNPNVLLQIGATTGTVGTVELSDFVVSTLGACPGAILIQYNLASSGTPSGMWDVHTRIGGFAGSDLQVSECPTDAGSSTVVASCEGAYMSMWITKSSTNLYMENCWLWSADHDMDDSSNTQVTIWSGRGLYVESTVGTFWFLATAVEHHVLYNYQFANTKNIFASQLQSETPYYMPTPNAATPFSVNSTLNDPNFASSCSGVSGNCEETWGLRIVDSSDMYIYGADHYSFFSSYSTTCSTMSAGEDCQERIVSIESSTSINIYNLNTIGSVYSLTKDGTSFALYSENENVYPSTVNVYRLS